MGSLADLLARARAALKAGETTLAARLFTEAQQLSPRDPEIPHERGLALLDTGAVGLAALAQAEALALDPGHIGARAQRAAALEALLHQPRLGADALEQGNDQPVLLLEQGGEQMLGEDLLVIALAGDRLGLLERLLCLDGKLVEFHGDQRNAATRRGKARASPW